MRKVSGHDPNARASHDGGGLKRAGVLILGYTRTVGPRFLSDVVRHTHTHTSYLLNMEGDIDTMHPCVHVSTVIDLGWSKSPLTVVGSFT